MRVVLVLFLVVIANAYYEPYEIEIGNAHQLDECGDPSWGPVLNGVDLVATFNSASQRPGETTQNVEPTMGVKDYSFTDSDGFVFYFATQQNREAYLTSPGSYPLGAGGFCGFACSTHDLTCDPGMVCRGPACLITPKTYTIASDGKLYFFFGKGGMAEFLKYDGLDVPLANRSSANCNLAVELAEINQGSKCYNTEFMMCAKDQNMDLLCTPEDGCTTAKAVAPGHDSPGVSKTSNPKVSQHNGKLKRLHKLQRSHKVRTHKLDKFSKLDKLQHRLHKRGIDKSRTHIHTLAPKNDA